MNLHRRWFFVHARSIAATDDSTKGLSGTRQTGTTRHISNHICRMKKVSGKHPGTIRARGEFVPVEIGAARIGFAICTELWAMEQARLYGKAGVHIIATPRATTKATVDKWLAGGRVAAIVSGAFSLSSNLTSSEGRPADFGGQGWIVGPDGQVMGVTSRERPFVKVEIDLNEAEYAKKTFPRYALP